MKQFYLIILTLFLFGCEIKGISSEKKITEKFKVQNTIFEYEIPESWIKTENKNEKGEIVLAQKENENLVIIQRYSNSENLAKNLFQQAQNNFFFFKPIKFEEKGWIFQGKPSSTNSLREFHQKIYPIKNSDIFLYASCSYEFSEEKESDCEAILNSWKILVDKK